MEATNKTRRAFGYVRGSSAGQGGEERDGIPRQKAAIRRHADAHNIRIVKWFAYTVSGKKELENRPALQELMTALHGNGTMLVLIEKLSYQEDGPLSIAKVGPDHPSSPFPPSLTRGRPLNKMKRPRRHS